MLRLIVFLILTVTLTQARQHTASELTGKWTEDGTKGNFIEFSTGSKISMNIDGITAEGAYYTIDMSKDPIWFDVYYPNKGSVMGLLEFADTNTIHCQLFFNGNRADGFTEMAGNPEVILKKK